METNPGPWRPVSTVCRLLCCNVRGLAGNLSDLTVASSQYDVVLRDFGLLSVTCRSCWFPDLVALSCCAGEGCLGPEGQGICTRWMFSISQPKFECGCCKMLVFRVCGVRQNLCVQFLPQH